MTRQRLIEAVLGISALVLLAVGCVLVMQPFLTSLMWAVVLCYASWPVYEWLEAHIKRRTLTALVMTLLVTTVLVLPFVVVGLSVADNARSWLNALKLWLEQGLPEPPTWLDSIPLIGDDIKAAWQSLSSGADLMATLQPYLAQFSDQMVGVGVLVARGAIDLALSVFIAFFIYRRGTELADAISRILTRVVGPRARHLLELAGGTIVGVVYGILGTALAQGLLAGIGFYIAGVPGALFLGLLTFFLSLVPMGPPLVWIPAAIWLYSIGEIWQSIFLALWGALLVSWIDNLLKPILISRGSQLPFVLVFMGVLGGVIAFGFIGVFLGPVLLAVAYTLAIGWAQTAPQASAEPAVLESPGTPAMLATTDPKQ